MNKGTTWREMEERLGDNACPVCGDDGIVTEHNADESFHGECPRCGSEWDGRKTIELTGLTRGEQS